MPGARCQVADELGIVFLQFMLSLVFLKGARRSELVCADHTFHRLTLLLSRVTIEMQANAFKRCLSQRVLALLKEVTVWTLPRGLALALARLSILCGTFDLVLQGATRVISTVLAVFFGPLEIARTVVAPHPGSGVAV